MKKTFCLGAFAFILAIGMMVIAAMQHVVTGVWVGVSVYLVATLLVAIGVCTLKSPERSLRSLKGAVATGAMHAIGVIGVAGITFLIEAAMVVTGVLPPIMAEPLNVMQRIMWGYAVGMIGFILVFCGIIHAQETRYFLAASYAVTAVASFEASGMIFLKEFENPEVSIAKIIFLVLAVVWVIIIGMGYVLKKDMSTAFKPKPKRESESKTALPTIA